MSTQKALILILLSVLQNELEFIGFLLFEKKKTMRIPELLIGCTEALTTFYNVYNFTINLFSLDLSLSSLNSTKRKTTMFFYISTKTVI